MARLWNTLLNVTQDDSLKTAYIYIVKPIHEPGFRFISWNPYLRVDIWPSFGLDCPRDRAGRRAGQGSGQTQKQSFLNTTSFTN